MSRAGQRGKPYHHGDLRRSLIEAAVQVITERGVGAFSLREVALRVGVSVTAPYRHFAGREALLAAVAADGFRSLADALAAPATDQPDILARLRGSAYTYVDFALANPARYRVMYGSAIPDRAPYPDLVAAYAQSADVLRAGVRQAQREGLVRPGEPTPVLRAMWFVMHGLASLAIDGQLERGTALRQVMDSVMTVVERGILATPD